MEYLHVTHIYANSRISLDDIHVPVPSGPQDLDGLILLSLAYTCHGCKCGGDVMVHVSKQPI